MRKGCVRLRLLPLALTGLGLAAGRVSAQPYAFVSNAAADSLSVIDLGSDTLVRSLPLAGLPSGAALSYDGRRLYVSRSQLGTLAVIDTATGAVGSIPVGASPAGVAVGPRDHFAYAANTGDDTVSVIQQATGTVAATIPVGHAPVELVAGGSRVYVANWADGTLSVIDTHTNTAFATLPVGSFPAGLALHWPTGQLYVASLGDDTVTAIDTRLLSVVATIHVARGPRGLALDAAGGRLYVASAQDGVIQVIDTTTHAVVQQAPSGGTNPVDLLLGPGAQRLYVTHLNGSPGLRVLDAATLAPVAGIGLPAGPVALAGVGSQAPPEADRDWTATLRAGLAALGDRFRARARHAPPQPAADTNYLYILDNEFDPENWQVVANNGSQVSTQEAAGGHDGFWRRTVHGALAVESWHLLVDPPRRYDPAVSGAIAFVGFNWDRLGSARERMLIRQNGVLYRTAERTFDTSSWEHAALTVDAGGFDDGAGGHPDFSSSGGVIEFGYYRRTLSEVPNVVHGIDSLQIGLATNGGPAGLVGIDPNQIAKSVFVPPDPSLTLRRDNGTQGAVVATLVVETEAGTHTQLVTWADGDGAPRNVAISGVPVPALGEDDLATVTITSVSGNALLAEDRKRAVLFVSHSDTPLVVLWETLGILFAGLAPAWLLALAAPALLLAARRRRAARARGFATRRP